MKIRRPLLATAAPVAAGLLCAVPALAAASPKVSFRVEGASRTLLAPKTLVAPSSGSITKGGTPAGVCPADSAAGALNVATHGDWGGTYSSGLGVEVTNILGTNALYAKGSYWEFFVNDRAASEGVCDTKLKSGEQLLFAQVPAKGKAELPLVVKAPTHVTDGRSFSVKTFVYAGKGAATKPVSGVKFDLVRGAKAAKFRSVKASTAGVTSLTPIGSGRVSLVAVAKGEIRSAPFTLDLSK